MIDVNDLNYSYSHKEVNAFYVKEAYRPFLIKVLKQWFIVVLKGIGSIIYFFNFKNKPIATSRYSFFAFTSNNKRVLQPIQSLMPDSYLYTNENLSFKKAWFYAMLYSPVIFFRYIKYTGYLKEVYATKFTSFCFTYGSYIEARKILKKIDPLIVVVANNHTYLQRCFYKAAQSLKIKTVFVQHASVTENFPVLDFSFAFLDGRETYEKFSQNRTCQSTVFLSGNPRFDIIGKLNFSRKISNTVKIGIALNVYDKIYEINKLICELKDGITNCRITIRPHPGMDIKIWIDHAKSWGCEVSNAITENPFKFIADNDVFIAGNSSFHLDVVMCNKLSFFYNLTGENKFDVYGYIKNGLIIDISDNLIPPITEYVNNWKSYSNSNARFYVENYNTEYWCKSAELISKTIMDLNDWDSKNLDYWKSGSSENLFSIN
jgi:hypothetical protein